MELDVVYAGVRARIGATLADGGPSVDDVRVPSCPDWNVAQLTAHLAGTISALVARNGPTGDTQAWVDGHVADRAGRTALENWREWESVAPQFAALLVAHPGGYGALLYDAIVHEDDINAALGRPSVRDADAVTYGLQRLFWGLDKQARAAAIGTLEVTTAGESYRAGDGDPVTTLRLDDRWEVLRAFGARRSAAQFRRLPLHGDVEAWLAMLPHDAPIDDLHER